MCSRPSASRNVVCSSGKLGDFLLDPHGHGQHAILPLRLHERLCERPLAVRVVLVRVREEEHRLRREEPPLGEPLELLRREPRLLDPRAPLDRRDRPRPDVPLLEPGLPVLRDLVPPLEPAVRGVQVRKQQLGLHDAHVAQGIGRTRRVRDVLVREAAHDVEDGVHVAQVREELVPEAFTLRRALHEPRDVHEADRGRSRLLGAENRGEVRQLGVGDGGDPDVLIDGAERVVRDGRARVRQRVQQRGLAHVRQPGDPHRERHDASSARQRAAMRSAVMRMTACTSLSAPVATSRMRSASMYAGVVAMRFSASMTTSVTFAS